MILPLWASEKVIFYKLRVSKEKLRQWQEELEKSVMPLKPGKGKEAISSNISELISTGRKPDQAVAISMRVAGKPKPQKKPK